MEGLPRVSPLRDNRQSGHKLQAAMKIAIASLMQETNSFSPLPTTVATFESYYLLRGPELLTGYGEARVEVPGFLATLRVAGATPVPLLAGHGAREAADDRERGLYPHHRRPVAAGRRGSPSPGGRGRGAPCLAVPGAALDRRARSRVRRAGLRR